MFTSIKKQNEIRKQKKQIQQIKGNAYQLYKNYQIPTYLYKRIVLLSGSENILYIEKIKELTRRVLRVKGFYADRNEEVKMSSFCKGQLKNHCI